MNSEENTSGEAIYQGDASFAPYALSVSSPPIAAIDKRQLAAGAVEAMTYQAQQQMDMLRKQAELIMEQVRAIEKRLEVSRRIYDAGLPFEPVIGNVYYFYERKNGGHTISMVAPKEWGRSMPFAQCEAKVRLLADKTWELLPLED
jgi:hypothetical protein